MSNFLLLFEYVAPELDSCQSARFVKEKKRVAQWQAAEAVWTKLSSDTRHSMNKPLDPYLLARFDSDNFLGEITPARVRCVLALEEAALVVQGLALSFKSLQPRLAALDSRQGMFIAGEHRIPVRLMLARLRVEADVPGAVAKEVWQAILSVLSEGQVEVPGLRVRIQFMCHGDH